jgi:hypothetical protein
MAVGRWGRGRVWLLAILWLLVGAMTSAITERPRKMWVLIACALVAKITSAIDAYRVERLTVLPGMRAPVAIGVGVVIYVELLAGFARKSIVEAFRTPTNAMYPTLEPGITSSPRRGLDRRSLRRMLAKYPPSR